MTTAAVLSQNVAVHSEAQARTRPASIAFTAVALLAVVAPFEMLQPIVRLPWQSISNVEAVLIAGGAAWVAAAVLARDIAFWRTPLTTAWLLFLTAMLVAAAAAPAERTNAVHMAGRLCVAFGLYLMTVAALTSRRRVVQLLMLLAAGGVAAALLSTLEYLRVRPVLDLLQAFRPGISVVGAQVRASGPLPYPTIASMYFEVVFACALGLLLRARDRGRHVEAAAWFVALALIAEGIVLSFTRAGLIAIAATLVFVAAARVRRGGWRDDAVRIAALLAIVVAAEMLTSRSFEAMRLRMTTEAQDAWYEAQIDAPATLAFPTDGTRVIPVTVANTGRLAWDPDAEQPFRFSYHWLLADRDGVVSYEGSRTTFPAVVSPGESVTLQVAVRAPRQPGRYRLMWDIVQEHRLWFSTEPGAEPTLSAATVTGAATGTLPPIQPLPLPRPSQRPGRLVLWRAAARMLARHPFLGVGPDNYRLLYGPFAALQHADPRVHTNDMYLEVLVGGGLLGGTAFAWLLWRAGRAFRDAVAADASVRRAESLAIAAAGLAIAVHGTVDSFLSFTPTYAAIAITVGAAVATTRTFGRGADADRI